MNILQNIVSNIKKDDAGKKLAKWSGIVLLALIVISTLLISIASPLHISYKIKKAKVVIALFSLVFMIINASTVIRHITFSTITHFTKKKVTDRVKLFVHIIIAAAVGYCTFVVSMIGFVAFAFSGPF